MKFTGGASQEESAAIAAVIAQILSEEETARSAPPMRPRQSDWVVAWRPRNVRTKTRAPQKDPSWTERKPEKSQFDV